MSSIVTGWILSVLGVSVLGVLVDIILPEGTMQKYIKSVFSILVVFTLIVPLLNINIENINFDNLIYNDTSIKLNQNYINSFNSQYKQMLEKNCEQILALSGFSGVCVEIDINLKDNKFEVEKVKLNLKKLVINTNEAHINKYTEMRECVANYLDILKEKVVFDEWEKRKTNFSKFVRQNTNT